jgi:hypothetical protein
MIVQVQTGSGCGRVEAPGAAAVQYWVWHCHSTWLLLQHLLPLARRCLNPTAAALACADPRWEGVTAPAASVLLLRTLTASTALAPPAAARALLLQQSQAGQHKAARAAGLRAGQADSLAWCGCGSS